MRGQKYQALIVVILLLTALPYSPFLSRASTIEKDPLAEKDIDGDGIPDPPMRDSDGDGLSDCLLYTSPSPRDQRGSRMPSSA